MLSLIKVYTKQVNVTCTKLFNFIFWFFKNLFSTSILLFVVVWFFFLFKWGTIWKHVQILLIGFKNGGFFSLEMSSRTTVLSKKCNSCRLAGPWSNRGVWKKIYTYMYKVARELFSLYSENTSSAGKKTNSCPMISNIETLSIRFLFVFFSFGHRWGSIITGIRNYSLSFGIENRFLLMGMFGGG